MKSHILEIDNYDTIKINKNQYRDIMRTIFFKAVEKEEILCHFLPDGTLIYVSEAFCNYYNKNQREFIGDSLISIIPKYDYDKLMRNSELLDAENPSIISEHKVINHDNKSVFWFQWELRGIFDSNNNLVEYRLEGHNITRLKEQFDNLVYTGLLT